ncbi:MAG: MBOAT family protein [Candidatus Delongbacteria bacterium]|jgi:alginate O-acetyltransferase complex protein AlgI|nr:MBOAT family protein [Candidatus Delongbacteria bacterium]
MDFIKNFFLYDPREPMIFTHMYFWVFFALLLLFYVLVYKKNVLRNTYLFLFSLFFYWKSGGHFFTILIFSTIVDYTLGQLIYSSPEKWKKKLFVGLSVFVNLGLLAYFKYAYLLAETINDVFSTDYEVIDLLAYWTNQLAGTSFDASTIILPVGISFFTFQTISYSVDVYRGKTKPVKNIVDFGFYVSFFPQLVAGPIVRAADFIPQLYTKYQLSKQAFGKALFLILNGLIKKMVISDFISINFVDRVFANPELYTGFENLLGVYGYGLQIYCDFSGYTDIAIGVALLLGFRLPLNFNSPYKAESITDFWRRWHISLSSWLRDYLYIPLGGNRKGKTRTYINLMITMLLGGLWHGAAWRFVIWGGLHGIGLAIHKLWMQIVGKTPKKKTFLIHFLSVFLTFNLVSFAWIFFRAQSMEAAGNIITRIGTLFDAEQLRQIPEILGSYGYIFALMLFGYIVHWLPKSFKDKYIQWFIDMPWYLKVLIAVIVVFILYQFRSAEIQPFIYFQF